MLVRGTDLNQRQRQLVFAAFVYRWTKDNPHRLLAWGRVPEADWPRVPLMTDEEWLTLHAFYFTKQGALDERYHHCEPAYMVEETK